MSKPTLQSLKARLACSWSTAEQGNEPLPDLSVALALLNEEDVSMQVAARLIILLVSRGVTDDLVDQLSNFIVTKKHWPLAVAASSIPESFLKDVREYSDPLAQVISDLSTLTLSSSMLRANPSMATPLELTALSRCATAYDDPSTSEQKFELEPTPVRPHYDIVQNLAPSFDYLVELGLKTAPTHTRTVATPKVSAAPAPALPRLTPNNDPSALVTLGRHGPNASAPSLNRRRTYNKSITGPGASKSSLPALTPSTSVMRRNTQTNPSSSLLDVDGAGDPFDTSSPMADTSFGGAADDDDDDEIVEVPVENEAMTPGLPNRGDVGAGSELGSKPHAGKSQKNPSIREFQEKLYDVAEQNTRPMNMMSDTPLPTTPLPDTAFARIQRQKQKKELQNKNRAEREQKEKERKRKRMAALATRKNRRSRGGRGRPSAAHGEGQSSDAGSHDDVKDEDVVVVEDDDSSPRYGDAESIKRQRIRSPRHESTMTNEHVSTTSSRRRSEHDRTDGRSDTATMTSKEYSDKRTRVFSRLEKEVNGSLTKLSLEDLTLIEDFIKGSNSMFAQQNAVNVLLHEDKDGKTYYATLTLSPRGINTISNYPV